MVKLSKRSSNNNKKSISLTSIFGVAILCILSFGAGLNFSILSSTASLSCNQGEGFIALSSSSSSSSSSSNSNDYHLASSQSYGFFQDVPSKEWKIRQQIHSQYIKHRNTDDPLEFVPGHSERNMVYFNSPHAFYQSNYEPNFSCSFERRIGGNGNGDGPKWVCDPHRLIRISEQRKSEMSISNNSSNNNDNIGDSGSGSNAGCLVYSVGSNGDFQFEVGLQTMLGSHDICEIHIFDMGDFEEKMPKGMNMHYHRWGLESEKNRKNKKDGEEDDYDGDDDSGRRYFYSFQETVKKLGHENRPAIDILKIDCEKCEWRTREDWFDPSVPMIQQILVETHQSPSQFVLGFFDGIMEHNDYVMFHKEPNIQFTGGDAIEFGFLKLDKTFYEAGGGTDEVADLTLKYII